MSWEEKMQELAQAVEKVDELEKENERMEKALRELANYCELHSDKMYDKFQEICDRNRVYIS